ncbi:uncharacterized protein N7503_000806 [Penicillium pulvis]|uniref:uncharacterized protein n=1 Tax=Penicillium pulvis TaxID=1562058 RepID=UPI002547E4A2|nr:uncharacterized protein N7503_000806 [Penicillium pulvis]KAJ5814056.1 hypothetical protein N7503_000806 [Penicillium pulvis]
MPVEQELRTAGAAIVKVLAKIFLAEPTPPVEDPPVEEEGTDLPEPILIPSNDTNEIQGVRKRSTYIFDNTTAGREV